jgi:hypothetical protein
MPMTSHKWQENASRRYGLQRHGQVSHIIDICCYGHGTGADTITHWPHICMCNKDKKRNEKDNKSLLKVTRFFSIYLLFKICRLSSLMVGFPTILFK